VKQTIVKISDMRRVVNSVEESLRESTRACWHWAWDRNGCAGNSERTACLNLIARRSRR
jgi:hypothetical protein